MSVIIVSVVLLGLALSGSTIAFFTRFNGLDRESYAEAQSLARSCADQALLQLAQNYAYTASHHRVFWGTDSCSIDSVTALNATVTVMTSAKYGNSYATYATTTVVAY